MTQVGKTPEVEEGQTKSEQLSELQQNREDAPHQQQDSGSTMDARNQSSTPELVRRSGRQRTQPDRYGY